jgi:carboxynorspermidine decarboxylase
MFDESELTHLLAQFETPCYIIDEAKLIGNLRILRDVKERAGCHILLAQKAFAAFPLYPLIGEYLDGTTASGLFEARLGKQMGKENHVFAPAYRDSEIDEIAAICDHVVFNSLAQWHRHAGRIAGKCSPGLRINPECSTQNGGIYDPCARFSRLGITKAQLGGRLPGGIEGLHFHTLCEQDSDALETTLNAFIERFGSFLPQLKWLNLGGGHHITRAGYDIDRLVKCITDVKSRYNLEIYLEPGEAVALNAGYLAATVLDIVHNEADIAILNVSAACHMPDVLEMPYRPNVIGDVLTKGDSSRAAHKYRLAGNTCLAGDVIGDYAFENPLKVGDRLYFTDMAIYSMVKNNTFNGIGLPSIALLRSNGRAEVIRRFDYSDFRGRLG